MNLRMRLATRAFALFASALAVVGAQATDNFDVASSILTLPSVSAGGQTYFNANVKIGGYSQLTVAGGTPVADTFNPATNILTMGSVTAGGQTYNNVTVHIDSYTINSVGTPPVAASNVVPITVDSGPVGNSINVLFASVTVCSPGSRSQCQTVDHVLLDSGSTGLRVLSGVLSPAVTQSLPTLAGSAGFPLLNCVQFLDNSFTWGPMVSADVSLGGNTASSVPIQVIADPRYNALSGSCSTGLANDSARVLGANGILGVGLFQQDCGAGCANRANNGYYYTCANAACSRVTPTAVGLNQQLQNVVGALAQNNNGIVIDLPAVGDNPVPSISGSMILGINTQANNQLASTPVLTTDQYGSISTAFNGKNLSTSFLDTGSNGLYFDTTSIAQCTSGRGTGFYCPPGASTLTAVQTGANRTSSAVSFRVDNANNQLANQANSVLPLLTGPVYDSQTFDWGLPFFLGRRVFVGFQGKTAGTAVGPYFAF